LAAAGASTAPGQTSLEPPDDQPDQETAARALLNAAREGDAEAVQYFLAAGASPDGVPASKAQYPPLMAAALGGHTDVVQALVRAGADRELAGREEPWAV
jgi:ankyrin repeat protein